MHQLVRNRVLLLVIACLTLWLTPVSSFASNRIETAGDIGVVAVTAAAAGMAVGLDDREGLVQLLKSSAVNLAATMALKYSVDERRPDGDRYSFPSAHASIAFTSAEYLRKRYGWQYGLPAYGAAAFVAYSRVEADRHYVHDVLAGAAIGMVSSYLFTTPKDMTIRAETAGGYYGVRLTQVW